MMLMTLRGQRSVSGKQQRERQIGQERAEGTEKLTNVTRLRLDFVSDDPAKTGRTHSALVLMICVAKHTHTHQQVIYTC